MPELIPANSPGLIAYFLLAHSVGLVALAVAIANWLRQRTQVTSAFAMVTGLFACIAATSLVQNLLDPSQTASVRGGLSVLNYLAAAGFVAALPRLIHLVYDTPGSHTLNRIWLGLSLLTLATGACLWLLKLPELAGLLVLSCKNLALLYTLIRIAANWQKRRHAEMTSILHAIMLGNVPIFPLIVMSEIAPSFFQTLIPVDFHGSLTLPLAFFAWSLSYLLSWFRSYTKSTSITPKNMEAFCATYKISAREVEVAQLLLDGKSYKEIMADLLISMPTVKSHITSIYRKTGCHHKMQLSQLVNQPIHPKV